MHWLDLLIIAIVAWFTFRAFTAGLIREVVMFAALIAGVILAGQFYRDLAADIAFAIDDEQLRQLIAFISIFAGVVVIGSIAAHLLRRIAALLLLGPFDHLGGAAFGFAKGILLVEVLLFAAVAFPVASGVESAVDQSALAPLFLDGIPVLLEVLPAEFRAAIDGIGITSLPAVSR